MFHTKKMYIYTYQLIFLYLETIFNLKYILYECPINVYAIMLKRTVYNYTFVFLLKTKKLQ